jgi:hypothetical protein
MLGLQMSDPLEGVIGMPTGAAKYCGWKPIMHSTPPHTEKSKLVRFKKARAVFLHLTLDREQL